MSLRVRGTFLMWCMSAHPTSQKWHVVVIGQTEAICGRRMVFPIEVLWLVPKGDCCKTCLKRMDKW